MPAAYTVTQADVGNRLNQTSAILGSVSAVLVQEAINALPEAERPEVICSASAVGRIQQHAS